MFDSDKKDKDIEKSSNKVIKSLKLMEVDDDGWEEACYHFKGCHCCEYIFAL